LIRLISGLMVLRWPSAVVVVVVHGGGGERRTVQKIK
jgi:hypothetical protein